MTLINVKRYQQALFQQASGMNRAAGTGGGSGFLPMQPLVNPVFAGINQSFTGVGSGSAVDITSSSGTFSLTRQCYVFIFYTAQLAVTGGADFAYVYLDIDGTNITAAMAGDGPRGFRNSPLNAVPLLAAGAHTIKLRGYVGAGGTTGKVLGGVGVALQLGA
jgi:hypothetical protein